MKSLKTKLKGTIAVMCAFLMVCMVMNTPTYAAYTRKCYLINNSNTTVYSNSGLTRRYGTIYGSDEITVLYVTSRYCRVSYPISGSRTKTGYIPTNTILTGTSGSTYTASAQVTTYRRPNGYSYGYISRGDRVTILGTYGNYTQVKYPVSSGYKYGFITTANANAYIRNANSGSSISSEWQMPMVNMYVCGNNWLGYYSKRPTRPYHLGIDVASRSGNENVYSISNGTVAATGYNSSNGNFVIIKHNINGNTIYSFYAHLKNYCVYKNSSIAKGQKIGIFGNTGSASAGRHLHFAITNTLSSSGGYYGYGTISSGNRVTYNNIVYYNPFYVINNGKLP